jgi:hypothetical protein
MNEKQNGTDAERVSNDVKLEALKFDDRPMAKTVNDVTPEMVRGNQAVELINSILLLPKQMSIVVYPDPEPDTKVAFGDYWGFLNYIRELSEERNRRDWCEKYKRCTHKMDSISVQDGLVKNWHSKDSSSDGDYFNPDLIYNYADRRSSHPKLSKVHISDYHWSLIEEFPRLSSINISMRVTMGMPDYSEILDNMVSKMSNIQCGYHTSGYFYPFSTGRVRPIGQLISEGSLEDQNDNSGTRQLIKIINNVTGSNHDHTKTSEAVYTLADWFGIKSDILKSLMMKSIKLNRVNGGGLNSDETVEYFTDVINVLETMADNAGIERGTYNLKHHFYVKAARTKSES